MATILIMGGSGFIGSAIVAEALAHGHAVSVLNRGSRVIDGTSQLIADRNDAIGMQNALGGLGFDVLVDTNAYRAEQVELLLHVLERRVQTALMISSASVYSDAARQPADERQPALGASAWGDYGRNKRLAEEAYLAAELQHVAIVRPPYVFGPANVADRETWFWSRQLNRRRILLPGDGNTPVQFVHKADLARAVILLAESRREGHEIFNVADPMILTLAGLAKLLAEVSGSPDQQYPMGSLAGSTPAMSWFPFRDYPCLAGPELIMNDLGWRTQASLRQRFIETFAEYDTEVLRHGYRPNEVEIALERVAQRAIERRDSRHRV